MGARGADLGSFLGVIFGGLGAEAGQQLKDVNHDRWLRPGRADGRLKFAIRSLFTARVQVASSSKKTRITTEGSIPEGGQQQLKDANHDR